jgi:prepilin-type N-terminal cleavage/methylation domain-containing protein
MNRDNGFTLIELLLVILLLGIIGLFTFPNFRDFLAPRDMKRTVLGLVGTMRYAQSQAATTKHKYRLNFDVKENSFWISREGEIGKFSPDPTPYGHPTHLPTGFTFLDIIQPERGKTQDGLAHIEFSTTGWAEECTIHLKKNEQEVFTLFVRSLGGKVEVEAGYAERVQG